MSKKVYIYHIKSASTGKGYVGSTKNLYKRENEHFSALSKKEHPNRYLQNAFNKYGKNDFTFSVIGECYSHERNKVEEWYINESVFNSEFNLQMVVDCDYDRKEPYKKIKKEDLDEIETLIQSGLIAKDIAKIKNISKGTLTQILKNEYYNDIKIKEDVLEKLHKNSSETKKRIKRYSAKNVFVYKTDGEFVGEFDSVPSVSEKFNLNKCSVMNALSRGIRLKDFLFYREKREFSKYIPNQTSPKREICVFDKDFNFLKTHESMVRCASEMNINSNRINSACNRMTLSGGSYFFIRKIHLEKFFKKYNINKPDEFSQGVMSTVDGSAWNGEVAGAAPATLTINQDRRL